MPASNRLSKAALCSLIFGILGCVPCLGIVGMILGIPGFLFAGKPGMRGQWMAVTGIVLGLLTTGGWSVAAFYMVRAGRSVAAIYRAPGEATQAYIQALAAGDEVAAREHASVTDEELQTDKAIIQAQGAFVSTDFNYTQFNEGGSSHITGFATFSKGALWVKADLSEVGGKWKVESGEFTFKK